MKHTPILSIPASYAPSVAARIQERSMPGENGCIIFTGAKDHQGYGKIKLTITAQNFMRMTGAHRAAWLSQVGDIPDGLTVDHICFVVACVNVEHMRLVTNAENARRRRRPPPGRPKMTGERSCKSHGRLDGYLKTRKDGYSVWECRVCRREYSRRYKERQKLKLVG